MRGTVRGGGTQSLVVEGLERGPFGGRRGGPSGSTRCCAPNGRPTTPLRAPLSLSLPPLPFPLCAQAEHPKHTAQVKQLSQPVKQKPAQNPKKRGEISPTKAKRHCKTPQNNTTGKTAQATAKRTSRNLPPRPGKDAPIPEHPYPGQRWREVRHDSSVTWLAYWRDTVNPKEFKWGGCLGGRGVNLAVRVMAVGWGSRCFDSCRFGCSVQGFRRRLVAFGGRGGGGVGAGLGTANPKEFKWVEKPPWGGRCLKGLALFWGFGACVQLMARRALNKSNPNQRKSNPNPKQPSFPPP